MVVLVLHCCRMLQLWTCSSRGRTDPEVRQVPSTVVHRPSGGIVSITLKKTPPTIRDHGLVDGTTSIFLQELCG